MSLSCKVNYRFWLKLSVIYFTIQFIVRSLMIFERPPGLLDIIDVYADGLLWDLGAWTLMSLPLLLFSLFLKDQKHRQFLQSRWSNVCEFIFCMIFVMVGVSELVFWNEFHSRFNFIAVDYLIYTNEVLANLKESYPMGLIISGVLVMALILTKLSSMIKFKDWDRDPYFRKRTIFTMFGFIVPAVFTMGIGPWLETHEPNFREDQLSRNGMIEFVRAFRSNHIDYQAFYATKPMANVESLYQSKKVPLGKPIIDLSQGRPNVVMIVVESLGAKFIAPLRGQPNTTPFLNELADHSVFFENFYATGTRTVRGLEALNLSVPPTPGYAVVKRPNHKNLYSMGHTFASNGYEPMFLYGGQGFFDNMNSFFSGNEFQVIDQNDFKKEETTFSNAWGVCDEDLFKKANQVVKNRKDQQRPFLLFMLTTSNHRPFTYPDGKIDIPSGTSRAGAVKYTDYAIGNFLKSVQNEEWAQNTLFVVVADHSTEGRGRFDLEMSDFHIPMWFYSPKLLAPQKISKMGSQIDLLPTLIHMLGLKDESPFFGQSLFNPNWTEERAFIGNYQYVGYYKDQILTTLGPNRIVRNYKYNPQTRKQKVYKEAPFLDEAISYYQLASDKLDSGKFNHAK